MPKSLIVRLCSFLVIVTILTELASLLVAPTAIRPVLMLPASLASQTVDLPWPTTGQAAIGAQGFGVLASSGPQTSAPIASVAKIITALSVLSEKPFDVGQQGPIITLGTADLAYYQTALGQNGSVIPVDMGEQLTERQALEAMLLPSANNMAYSLATWAFGSLDNYNTFANQFVKKLGMTQTTVTDSSGLSPTTLSSATDLVKLAQAAMAQPVLADIVSERTAFLPVAGTARNTNWLLGTDGIIGIKTGNTDQAGGCFMFAAKQNISSQSVTVVGAVMNAPDLTTAMDLAHSLVTASINGFLVDALVVKNQAVATYQSAWGVSSAAIAQDNLSVLVWRGQQVKVEGNLIHIYPGTKANSIVGTVEAVSPSQTKKVFVVTKSDVPKPSVAWRLLHPAF